MTLEATVFFVVLAIWALKVAGKHHRESLRRDQKNLVDFHRWCRRQPRYRALRSQRLMETQGHCEFCGDWHESRALEFAHLNEDAYGNERPDNMALLCVACHRQLDAR